MKVREGYRWRPRDWRPNAREQLILDAIAAGRTNAEIGQALGITTDGVKWYVGELLLETGLANRRELASWWSEPGRQEAVLEFRGPTMLLQSTALDQAWRSDTPAPNEGEK